MHTVPFDALGVAFAFTELPATVLVKVGSTVVASHDLWAPGGILGDHQWTLDEQELTLLDLSLQYDADREIKVHRGVDDAHVATLSTLTELMHLDISECDQITDAGISTLSALVNLEHLNIRFCERVTDAGVASLKSLSRLQHLDLWDCNRVTDVGVASLSSLVGLHHLDLSNCYRVTDAGIDSLAGLVKLERLNLRCCGVTDTV